MGRITAQWFEGGPNKRRLNSVMVRLEKRLGWATKCWGRGEGEELFLHKNPKYQLSFNIYFQ